ncbi:hypothetical protein B0H67DRAFT_553052 [Lasiosphaeris hirsuta]|uniref:C2H2-type domain-containing protein n=1 Tax=Lasiosphaeris hirsuta TaxID=260670 RepID=A0AA40AS24_9PEZI|nr:hypothetical protein B0H67DRAFT_553052 [Lasiosphaeris hirsuta]
MVPSVRSTKYPCSSFNLWQCCKCRHGSMTVAATPSCPMCSHPHCLECYTEVVELSEHRAGSARAPESAPPGWPSIIQRAPSPELIEPPPKPVGISDPGCFGASPPDSSVGDAHGTVAPSDCSSPNAGMATPTTPTTPATSATPTTPSTSPTGATSSSNSGSDWEDDGGGDERYYMERHEVAEELFTRPPGFPQSVDPTDPLFELLFSRYQQWRQSPATHTPAGSGGSNSGDMQGISSRTSTEAGANANSQEEREGSEESEVREVTESSPGSLQAQARDLRFLFACPFWKHNRVDWKGCFGYKLRRIRDVKQHLKRKHSKPLHCGRCGEELHTGDRMNDHQPHTAFCHPRQLERRWLSEAQKKSLEKRSSGTPEKQWYAMWDIIFPQHPQPNSPYLDGSLSEDLNLFLEFLLNEGPSIIQQASQSDNFGYPPTTQNRRFMQMGLRRVYELWASAQAADSRHPESAVPATETEREEQSPAALGNWSPALAMEVTAETQHSEMESRNDIGDDQAIGNIFDFDAYYGDHPPLFPGS